MKKMRASLVLVTVLACTCAAGQVAVQANPNQEQMLVSADPRIAANKRLVYDFWREVFEGAHMELADKYMAESYIQQTRTCRAGARRSSISSAR